MYGGWDRFLGMAYSPSVLTSPGLCTATGTVCFSDLKGVQIKLADDGLMSLAWWFAGLPAVPVLQSVQTKRAKSRKREIRAFGLSNKRRHIIAGCNIIASPRKDTRLVRPVVTSSTLSLSFRLTDTGPKGCRPARPRQKLLATTTNMLWRPTKSGTPRLIAA